MAANSQIEGFGYNKVESQHHFLVRIPSKKSELVVVSEHFTEDESTDLQQTEFCARKSRQ